MKQEEFFVIKSKDFKELLKVTDYSLVQLTKLKRFGGKKIWIDGDLDVVGLPIESLGNIGYIDGNLNISNTNIADLGDVKVTGYISDHGSKRWKIKQAEILREKRNEQLERKNSGEWDPENYDNMDEEGLRANALILHLGDSGDEKVLDDELRIKLEESKNRLEILYQRKEQEEETDEIDAEIDELEEIVMDIESEYIDVYELYPSGEYYGMTTFEILGSYNSKEYAVIEESRIDDAVKEYAENTIDDLGVEGFSSWAIENCIDKDQIRREVEEYYENDIRDSPESYFTKDDFKLSDEQENRIEELESYIEEMEELKSSLEDEQNSLNDSIKEPEEYRKEYENIQEKIDEIDENIEKAQDELDEIEPSDEPTEDMISDKVEEMVEDRMDDPKSWIDELGFNIQNYVDKDCLAEEWVRSDGYGIMNSYDGGYDSIKGVDSDWYIVMRLN
jgi:hypothetical protein